MNANLIDDPLARFHGIALHVLHLAYAVKHRPAEKPPKFVNQRLKLNGKMETEKQAAERLKSTIAFWKLEHPRGVNPALILDTLEWFFKGADAALKGAEPELAADIIATRDFLGDRIHALADATRFHGLARDSSGIGLRELESCVSRLRHRLAVIAVKSGGDAPAAISRNQTVTDSFGFIGEFYKRNGRGASAREVANAIHKAESTFRSSIVPELRRMGIRTPGKNDKTSGYLPPSV